MATRTSSRKSSLPKHCVCGTGAAQGTLLWPTADFHGAAELARHELEMAPTWRDLVFPNRSHLSFPLVLFGPGRGSHTLLLDFCFHIETEAYSLNMSTFISSNGTLELPEELLSSS